MITDVSGRLLRVIEGEFKAEYNEVSISASDLGSKGVLLYQLDTPGFTAIKKMVLIE